MKIALFHNFMDNIGGAEFMTLTLARELKADIYTTVVNQEYIQKMGFNVSVHSIGWVPKNAPFRQQLTAWRFSRLSLKNEYDFYIIGGDWAAAGGKNNRPNLWLICSPPRELWDLYKHTRDTHVGFWGKWLFDAWVYYNRKLTQKNIDHTDTKVTISKNVCERVKSFLHEDTQILYPPTETKNFYYKKNGASWLSVNRLIDHKRIELQLDAFRKLPHESLTIVGSFEKSKHFKRYAQKIISSAPKNVTIKSWVTASDLQKLYAECKGFITTSLDEDYGMNVVEAMASGKPVIAPNEGGYKETIINGKTGILINHINADSLATAITTLGENPEHFKEDCIARAKEFDTTVFINKIEKLIQETLQKTSHNVSH